ncbi:DUF6056 family protein [Butyrivibrio sp. VCB2006]|uniref:DUF6056 family protein n=1 Tax=Butyrivibrio sp. VCB2006 TaxID=1280679 RepID=UPI000414CCFC|nr:DUF6056 family protein [Butyrivibrio sp. VCB2006]
MFNYKVPGFSGKINTKTLSIVMTVLYVLTIIPLLVLGHFNWLSADDMSMAYKAHEYYINGGNIFGLIGYVIKVTADEYMNWVGYFFSATLSSLCPGIFGEKLYFLVVYEIIGMLTLGVCYFFNALFVHGFRGDKHLANVVSMATLMVIIQSMPFGMPRVEAFYWHSGAINYMFMFGLGLLWVGLLIRVVFDKKEGSGKGKLLWACILGFLLGGANYMTALELAIVSVLVLVILGLRKSGFITVEGLSEDGNKNLKLLWIPAVLNLMGFVMSCLAPGNKVRASEVEGFGAVKSILIAFYDVFDICINQYLRWEVILVMLLLIPVFWKLSESIEHRFEHPFIFALFALGMSAAGIVPPLFATGSVEAGRLLSIFWAEFVVMLELSIFYLIAWVRQTVLGRQMGQNSGSDMEALSGNSALYMCVLFLIIAFGAALCIKADPHYFSATSACYDIASGNAGTYRQESMERLSVLTDDSVSDAVLDEYTVKPSMLFFSDVEEDTDFWINIVVARYYHKNTVLLRKN